MVVPGWSVWFFLAYVFEILGPHPFVLLHRVFDVLSLCFLVVLVGPQEVFVSSDVFIREVSFDVIIVLPGLSCSVTCSWAALPRPLR